MKKILSLALLGAISANAMNMVGQPPQLLKNASNTSTKSNSSNESNVSDSIRSIQEYINNKEYGTELQELSQNFLESKVHKLDIQEIMLRLKEVINKKTNKDKKIKIETFIAQVHKEYKGKKKQKELKEIAHVIESFMEIAKELEKSKQGQKDLTGTLKSTLNKMCGKKKAAKIMKFLREMRGVAKLLKNDETTCLVQDLIAEQNEAQNELDVLSAGLQYLLSDEPSIHSQTQKQLLDQERSLRNMLDDMSVEIKQMEALKELKQKNISDEDKNVHDLMSFLNELKHKKAEMERKAENTRSIAVEIEQQEQHLERLNRSLTNKKFEQLIDENKYNNLVEEKTRVSSKREALKKILKTASLFQTNS